MKVCVIDLGFDVLNFDFIWGNIMGDNDSGIGNWYDNGGFYGIYVVGIIGVVDNNIGVVGMVLGVVMYIIKVFNVEGWGYFFDLVYVVDLCF